MPDEELVAATETTVALLRASGVAYELRTTVVPGLLEAEDLMALGEWMEGAPRFFLQQFRPGRCLDPLFSDLRAYPPEFLRRQAEALSPFFGECAARGID